VSSSKKLLQTHGMFLILDDLAFLLTHDASVIFECLALCFQNMYEFCIRSLLKLLRDNLTVVNNTNEFNVPLHKISSRSFNWVPRKSSNYLLLVFWINIFIIIECHMNLKVELCQKITSMLLRFRMLRHIKCIVTGN